MSTAADRPTESESDDSPRPALRATGEMADWDAVQTAARIRSGQVSADEVLAAAIDRAEQVNPTIAGLVTPAFDAALAALRSGDRSAPLFGVPSAVKDLDEQAGIRTTFGTRASGTHISRHTTPTVRQFLDTGVLSLGKSAAPEYGMNPSGESLGFPPTRNPWNIRHTAGGSSSGAGALVAAGVVPLAYAADGGGSTRIPAACCGVVGLKPTYGRLVTPPDMRLLPVKLVTYGVITRTVGDTAAFYAAAERVFANPALPVLGHVRGSSPARRRIGVITTSTQGEVAAEVAAVVRRTADDLDQLGHSVDEIAMPFSPTLGPDFLLYWGLLAQSLPLLGLREVGPSFKPSLLDPWTKGLAAHARRNAHRIPGAIRRLRGFAGEYATLMSRFHAVLTPMLGTPPPLLGHLAPGTPFAELEGRVREFCPFTPAWNVSGAPAISLPMGLSRAGLPIGVQLGAAHGDDRTLLELGYELEATVGFNRRLVPG